MTKASKILIAAGLGALIAVGATGYARAQSGVVSQAITAGTVGEQADGYLGVRGSVSAALRAEVDSINIKRRAAYTQQAASRGVTVQDWAAAVGCQTLANRVKPGEAYRLPDGIWRVRDAAPVPLPGYCAT